MLSVADKTGIVEFAKALLGNWSNWEIISTGGTAKHLRANGVPVTMFEDLRFRIFQQKMQKSGLRVKNIHGRTVPMKKFFTNFFPTEMLGHRVAPLHAETPGGILAAAEMLAELAALGYPEIDLVCVDLYHFNEAVADPHTTLRQALEKIDIGGPTMLCGASKNLRIVVSCAEDRKKVIKLMQEQGELDEETRRELAADTFARIAQYRLDIARYLSHGRITGMILEKVRTLPYGENPNQGPAFLAREFDSQKKQDQDPLAIMNFTHEQGANPSFNNWVELSRLLGKITWAKTNFEINGVCRLAQVNAAATKHGNLAGFGSHSWNPIAALQRMIDGDRIAIHGGLVITDFEIGKAEAETLLHYGMDTGEGSKPRILDAVFAPSFTAEAKEILKRKGENKLRLITNPALGRIEGRSIDTAERMMQLRGAWVIQPAYNNTLDLANPRLWEQYFMPRLTDAVKADLCIAHTASHQDNSNTVAAARDGRLLASATGQQDRVAATYLLTWKAARAGTSLHGAMVSGDSFFPYDDGPTILSDAEVAIIMATSGSITGDPALRKMLVSRRDKGLPYPGVLLIPDKIGRGFCYHCG